MRQVLSCAECGEHFTHGNEHHCQLQKPTAATRLVIHKARCLGRDARRVGGQGCVCEGVLQAPASLPPGARSLSRKQGYEWPTISVPLPGLEV